MAPAVGAEAEAVREVPVADGITATIRASGLRLFVIAAAPTLRPALLQFGHPERGSLSS
jgi:hypothetical protein